MAKCCLAYFLEKGHVGDVVGHEALIRVVIVLLIVFGNLVDVACGVIGHVEGLVIRAKSRPITPITTHQRVRGLVPLSPLQLYLIG